MFFLRNCFVSLCIVLLYSSLPCLATEYNVGPDKEYTTIGSVPWESLNPGDHVYIHWRSTSYNEKWVIGRSGTASAPIVVSGVAGQDGQLPVIDGRNATTRQSLDFWNEKRGLIKIGGSNIPSEPIPSYIIVENLDLRSARPPYTFTNASGGQETYANNAASFYVEIGQHITIRNCLIHDSGNGIFVGANNWNTQDILIQGNAIYDNGIEGSYYEHNTYTEALRITYQYNFMGALRSGAGGNNLKDRSAGLVVRYNWIENGNRQLDLVDAGHPDTLTDESVYRKTYVYGNILKEADNEGNSQIIHYGGDSNDTSRYRKGTLYLYNNTVITTRSGNTTLLRLSTDDEFADVYNNILYPTADGSRFALAESSGQIKISHNWLKDNWRVSHSSFGGTLTDLQTSVVGVSPGFIDFTKGDYHLLSTSPCRNAGKALDTDVQALHPVSKQYRYHRGAVTRGNDGILDIGAFEYSDSTPGDDSDQGNSGYGGAGIMLLLLDSE
ncbi:polysaccharide-degrading enzyme [Desulfogranum japonicum]|uniref:polysaccharide-degrading enzyme n=1 Tax=Desulfogranum japonicum TaxID=231447 RepID=UPI001294824B|nr:polysaccharide-degrading enzyme [Desulfogranum japonicum]